MPKAHVVTLTSPTASATFTVSQAITVTATASDTDGSISKVEFYDGGTLANFDTAAPYTYSWTNASVGTHTITAKAYDNVNATTLSSPVTIFVSTASTSNQLPVVTCAFGKFAC